LPTENSFCEAAILKFERDTLTMLSLMMEFDAHAVKKEKRLKVCFFLTSIIISLDILFCFQCQEIAQGLDLINVDEMCKPLKIIFEWCCSILKLWEVEEKYT
jgi:hypothetical protein